MENIFEGAKFGDKFVTRNGSKLMFTHYLDDIDAYHCVLENWYETLDYAPDGKAFEIENHHTDIVSRYQEQIDEEKLDKLAIKECPYDEYEYGETYYRDDYINAFKDGYRKAKNEQI